MEHRRSNLNWILKNLRMKEWRRSLLRLWVHERVSTILVGKQPA
jgi:hypothetical protein